MTNKKKFNFGRKPSPFDIRDYNLKNIIPRELFEEKLPQEMVWDYPSKPLDQENTPHCVGFSIANFGINSPVNTMYKNQDGHDFYYMCKVIDGEPQVENGSYIRTAAKVLKDNLKRINAYAFAPDMETIKWWILNKGPMIVGTIWTEDMLYPNAENIVKPTGEIVGGHAYLLNEWRSDDYIGIQNSWGDFWGVNGKAYISAEFFEKLFNYDGEAMTALEIPIDYAKKSSGCLNALFELIKDIFENFKI